MEKEVRDGYPEVQHGDTETISPALTPEKEGERGHDMPSSSRVNLKRLPERAVGMV